MSDYRQPDRFDVVAAESKNRTCPVPGGQSAEMAIDLLADAQRYRELGWSIFPIKGGTKAPALRSTKAPKRAPADADVVRCWFDGRDDLGVAVAAGEVPEGTRTHKARLVKLRYFAGLTIPEAAQAMKVSVATAERHWAFARAWLHVQLSGPDE